MTARNLGGPQRVGSGMTEPPCTTAFSQAALDHIDALYGYALTLTRDQTEAEDLVQETYLRALRAFGQLTPNSNLKSWMFVILRNAWFNQLRHARSGPSWVELDSEAQTGARWFEDRRHDPHVIYLRKLARQQITEAIDSLPLLYREV